MLLGAFCLIAILVMGVLGCVSGSPIGGLAAKNVKPVPLTPMEQAQKDYASVTITYQIGDASEVLDSDRILSWLKENEDGSVTFDEQQAKAFVKSLAEKYDTAYTTRTFHTTSGHDIQITQGATTAGASTRRPRRRISCSCSPQKRARPASQSTRRQPPCTPRTTGARATSRSA